MLMIPKHIQQVESENVLTQHAKTVGKVSVDPNMFLGRNNAYLL